MTEVQVSPMIVAERVRDLARENGHKWEVLMAINVNAKTDPDWLIERLTVILPKHAEQVAKIWSIQF